MTLQDVSGDHSMLSWLREAGHSHILDEDLHHANPASSPPPPPPPPSSNIPFGQTTSSSNYPLQTTSSSNYPPQTNPSSSYPPQTHPSSSYPPQTHSSSSYPPQTISSLNYPPQTASLSSPPPPPIFGGGYNSSDSLGHTLNRSASYPQTDFHPTSTYGGGIGSPSPPIIPPSGHFTGSPYDHHSSPSHFNSSPTQFLAPNMNQQQLDMDIENMRRDPNTRVVQRPPQEDVVYKQRVFVRYLQPPTPPVGGTIIVREKQPPGPPPDPPIVIKRAPPPPPTPPPVIIRERPPPIPPAEGTTVIDKIIPPGPKPQRQVVIEQYPQLPPKPQDVIIERWLPIAPRQRRILYERLPPSMQQATRPIIVQYGPPHVRIQREIITAPGAQPSHQLLAGRTDINQFASQIGGNQQIHSTLSPSSLVSYNPYTTIQPSYGNIGQSQPNIVIMQNGQPSTLTPSSYGMPLTCVCTPNQAAGLGAYGSGVSAVPTIGQSGGQSMVYNVPDNVPIDNILRQLGIDPHTIQRSTGFPPTGFPPTGFPPTGFPPTDPHNAIAHVWNSAAHTNPPHILNPSSAVSHVWNAAAHTSDHMGPGPPYAGRAWDKIEHYLHPPSANPVRSVWDHIPHPSSLPPSSYNSPPRSSPINYPPPPPNYPPPPRGNYPPSQSSYHPQSSTNYPPSSGNYPPPPSGSYPPPPPSSSNPPSGGQSGGGASVLSRLFGGGR